MTHTDAVTVDPRLEQQLPAIAGRLHQEFGRSVSVETIERLLNESVDATDGTPIQTFRPIFVERLARDRLRAFTAAGDQLPPHVSERWARKGWLHGAGGHGAPDGRR